jgi:hypothetical protein
MVKVAYAIRFVVPYKIQIIGGQANSDMVFEVEGKRARVKIHPLASSEKVNEKLVGGVWLANIVDIEIEMEVDSSSPEETVEELAIDIANKYFYKFLRYCRFESKQWQIDTRQKIMPRIRYYVDRYGRETKPCTILGLVYALGPGGLDDSAWGKISNDIGSNFQTPLPQEALLDAKLYLNVGDYEMTVLTSAIGIESAIKGHVKSKLKSELVEKGKASREEVENFVDWARNRHLVNVGMALLSSVDGSVLEKCGQTLEIRNHIMHRGKNEVSKEEARKAVKSLEQLVSCNLEMS